MSSNSTVNKPTDIAGSNPLEPISLPPGNSYQTSEMHDFATPTQELYSPLSPPVISEHSIFDRRGSIVTEVIEPDDGMRVLLVEDNEINLKLLVAYMRKLKLNHATAINGLEALNAYKEAHGRFDVIFMGMSQLLFRIYAKARLLIRSRYLHACNVRHREYATYSTV